MRAFAAVLVFGAALVGRHHLDAMDPLLAAGVAVAFGIVLGVLVSGPSAKSVAAGALGALAHTLLEKVDPVLAASALLAAAHTGRALRSDHVVKAVIVIGVALVAGAVSAWVVESYVGASWTVGGAAVGISVVLSALPWVLRVDDPITHRLRDLARRSGPPLRKTLVRALATRRRLADEMATLAPRDVAAVDAAYTSLATLAVARLGVGAARADALDRRIDAHAQAIGRARRVLITRRAAVSLGTPPAVSELRALTDALEVETDAFTDAERAAHREPAASVPATRRVEAQNDVAADNDAT